MRVLVSWLREFIPASDRPAGGTGVDFLADIDALADGLTMRGFEVGAVEPWPAAGGTAPDAVLDIEITTNRPDCLSVRGIARELATMYATGLGMPGLGATEASTHDHAFPLAIDDPDLCRRYAGALADVEVGRSPGWLTDRLDAAGVRPINNVVDVTNYVMIELGHPLHAFDFARLAGPGIVVRRAAPGERLRTLDGVEHPLDPEMLTIADAERPQAVAGIMGGADSEVSARTRTILLEAAWFNPISVRRASKRLALATDASFRFERGADVSAPPIAIARARTLLEEIGAGQARGAIVDCYPAPPEPIVVRLRHHRIGHLLGQEVDSGFVAPTLTRLGFAVEPQTIPDGPAWRVTVPSFRVDVRREEDLIEEVARHHGYDRLPETFPALIQPPPPEAGWRRRDRTARQVLTGCGFSEAITYGFIERAAALALHPDEADLVPLANPLSEKGAVLRPSLLPGLVDSLIHNRRRERQDIRLFELGSRFRRCAGETPALALAMTGAAVGRHWSGGDRKTDLFDLTGVITRLCAGFGGTAVFAPATAEALVPGRTALVTLAAGGGTTDLGLAGQLDPALARRRGLPGSDPVHVAELDLRALSLEVFDRLRAAPVPRHPSITRDVSIEIDDALPAAQVRGTMRAAAGSTLVSISEIDRYQGAGVARGAVSLSLRLIFRAADRTLTDAEVRTATDRVVSALEQTHRARLR